MSPAPRLGRPLRAVRLLPHALIGLALLGPAGPSAHAAPAAADEVRALAAMDLEGLLDLEVSGASRFAARRSESVASVSVIGRDELRAFGARTLADALRSVRGLSLSTDGIYQFASVRGVASAGDYNTRLLVLIDGNRLNDNVYDQGSLGSEFPIDIELVERIEFIPGPSSAVHGANALFGVVNVVTRAAGGPSRAGASLGLASEGGRRAQAWLQAPLGEGALLLSGSSSRRRGRDVVDPWRDDGQNHGLARGTDAERRDALFARWSDGPLSASLSHAERRQGIPTSPDLIFGDPGSRATDRYDLGDLQGHWTLAGDTELQTRVWGGRYRYLGDYKMDYPPVTLNHDLGDGLWWGAEARWSGSLSPGQRWLGGVEWRRDQRQLQRNEDLWPTPSVYLDDRRSGERLAVFGEAQSQLNAALTLHLGARLDRSPGEATVLSPRLGLVWQASEDWTLKALHGRAFRPPNAYERYYAEDAPGGSIVNPALRSEHVRGDELSAEWHSGPWRAVVSVHRVHAMDLLTLAYDPAIDRYQVRNAGTVRSQGTEAELEWLWQGHRLRAQISAEQPSGNAAWPAGERPYPRRTAWLGAVLALPHRATLGLEVAAMARRAAAPGYALTHLNLAAPLTNAATAPRLSLGLRNLFDRQVADPGLDLERQPLLRLPGREWRLVLDWEFGR